MTLKLKINWAIWFILVIVVTVGSAIAHFSSVVIVPIQLNPGETINISVFRAFPCNLGMTLEFKRSGWHQDRSELGKWRTKEYGNLEFDEPGEPIKLVVRCRDKEVIYEALPMSGYNGTSMNRDLVPFFDDNDPKRFRWPPLWELSTKLPSGRTVLNVSILEVGKSLVGERVTLIIESPINLKVRSENLGYRILWWFIFWPLYALLLSGYGIVLLSRTMPIKTGKK